MKRILIHLGLLAATLSVGAQYQLPNPGFEQWDGGTTSEPTHWNSFATSDGTFSGTLIPGQGIFARMAEEAGFKVMDAEDAVRGVTE